MKGKNKYYQAFLIKLDELFYCIKENKLWNEAMDAMIMQEMKSKLWRNEEIQGKLDVAMISKSSKCT